ncbi:histidine phosphatase family protein [Lewinella sp. IMCC34183]|uniref:histidine phosphatase family protein n=1 Tax=Lewinella sp. IMCC34183 TaxID=2248762 RepID=UPI0018E5A5C6
MTRIGFVRHGITDWNLDKRVQGHTDIPLNEKGKLQAKALAGRLTNEDWDLIYSSDLSRAKETAGTIAEAKGVPVKLDHRLREMDCGAVEGTTAAERVTPRSQPSYPPRPAGIVSATIARSTLLKNHERKVMQAAPTLS